MFSSVRNVEVHGGASNTVHGDQYNTSYTVPPDNILEFIASKAAVNAFFNAGQRYPPPNCHPGTRVDVLAQLSRWISEEPKEIRAYWVYGPVGVGKSAIAQTISEEHAGAGGRLAASFFFSRNDETRDNLDSFVPTIVYQLLCSGCLPESLHCSIVDTIRSDPKIFDKVFEDQFRNLILKPCLEIGATHWETSRNLIVIDGLDECVDVASQERLLAMIREVITIMASPGLTFLIHSRPEIPILYELNHDVFKRSLGRLPIGDSGDTTEDIVLYFRNRFADLRKKHHSLQETDILWPGDAVILQLAERACGQFIFATTVMKYLDCNDELPLPSARLESILRPCSEKLPRSPYSELDQLYSQILMGCHSNWSRLHQVLSLLLTAHRPLSTPHPFPQCNLYDQHGSMVTSSHLSWRSSVTIAHLLKFEPGEVESLMYRLHAVIDVPNDSALDIRILHASFADFLSERSRSASYHTKELPPSIYFDMVAALLLRQLSPLSGTFFPYRSGWASWEADSRVWEHQIQNSSSLQRYSARNCMVFCQQVVSPSEDLLIALNHFDPYPVATMVFNLEETNRDFGLAVKHFFDFWKSAVSWAKALEKKPTKFIGTLESFLQGFRAAANPETQQYLAGSIALCESSLDSVGNPSWDTILRRIDILYRLFTFEDRLNYYPCKIYFLPIHLRAPFRWGNITLTSAEAARLHKLIHALLDVDEQNQERLLKDIAFGTYDSIGKLNLIERSRLRSLTKFVNARRQELGLTRYEYNTPLESDSSISGESDSVKSTMPPVTRERSRASDHSSSSSRKSRSSTASSHRNRSFVLTDTFRKWIPHNNGTRRHR